MCVHTRARMNMEACVGGCPHAHTHTRGGQKQACSSESETMCWIPVFGSDCIIGDESEPTVVHALSACCSVNTHGLVACGWVLV